MHILEIKKNDAGRRLDKFLLKAVKAMPPSLLYKSVRTKKIKVNRKRTTPDYILAEGDTVQLFLSDDLFNVGSDFAYLDKITPAFDTVYEDENILLADKPAGMLVHSDDADDTATLITHIKAYLKQNGEYDPDSEQSFAPALCNRIDRNTAGIVIAAKNAEALREMNDVVKYRRIQKKYLCATHGTFEKKSGELRGYIVKDSSTNMVKVYKSKPNLRDAKSIVTAYRVLDERNDLSLLEVELVTGRTHQIRAHFSSIGHPLLGDGKYGINRDDKKSGYKSQALYSYSLTFEDDGFFSYLKGKTFTVEPEKIWFLDEFPNFDTKKLKKS